MSVDESLDVLQQTERQRGWDEAREHFEHRAVIEQTKGMLMFVYGIDADAAFDLLRWQSQHHNVKLRLMAEQILQDFAEASRKRLPVDRGTYDALLVTAYTRTEPGVLRDVVAEMAERLDD